MILLRHYDFDNKDIIFIIFFTIINITIFFFSYFNYKSIDNKIGLFISFINLFFCSIRVLSFACYIFIFISLLYNNVYFNAIIIMIIMFLMSLGIRGMIITYYKLLLFSNTIAKKYSIFIYFAICSCS